MNHFRIPKLEVMQSFGRQTKANGALIQYTADVMEHLLITHCKTTFQRTSRQAHTYVDQVMDILNREESLRLFDLYIILRLSEHSALDMVVNTEHKAVTTINPTLEFIQHVLPNKGSTFRGPHPFRNHFEDPNSIVSTYGDVTLHVTVQPDHSALSMMEMQVLYHLTDLSLVMSSYIDQASHGNLMCGWDIQGDVSTWNKFRIQLHSSFRTCYIDKSQVVQAYPPSTKYPYGHCNAVLLCAQVMVFSTVWSCSIPPPPPPSLFTQF